MKGSPRPPCELAAQFTPQKLAQFIFNSDFSEVKIETCSNCPFPFNLNLNNLMTLFYKLDAFPPF